MCMTSGMDCSVMPKPLPISCLKMRPRLLRWTTPDQPDVMATQVGLESVERYSTWDQESYDPEGDAAISVYRRQPFD